ncbi:MAG: carbohydrate kinase family protein [Candidatus Bathyarchaeota archaeon]|nr:carbohydrate kinase family protein [Candidatus Bathyarchaeota archaeon]
MSMRPCKKELENFLENRKPKECRVVVMPDFFLDRFISLPWGTAEFTTLINQVVKRKGGSIDGISQVDMQGGNSINVASAIANLGAKVIPIICTSEYGSQQIKHHLKTAQVDTSHIKIFDKASVTTALEFQTQDMKTNVMLRDVGSLADFGPANLDHDDYKLIEEADYVCLFNWAGTLKFGTALAQAVFGRVKQRGRGKTYYATADPTPNADGISGLMENVLKTDIVDILSVNENEAVTYAALLDEGLNEKKRHVGFAELALEAARVLAKRLSARIDLHTTAFSATLHGEKEAVVPTFKVEPLRATGAGDAWDAGNITGDWNALSDECRLMLANAVSACYLLDSEGKHPNKNKLLSFLRSTA